MNLKYLWHLILTVVIATSFAQPLAAQGDPDNSDAVKDETSNSDEPSASKDGTPETLNEKKEKLEQFRGLGPEETYLKMHDIFMKAESFAEIKPYLAEDSLTSMMATGSMPKNRSHVDQEIKENQIFKLMKVILYPQVKVVSVNINGDTAVLKAVPISKSLLDKGIEDMADGLSDSISQAVTGQGAAKPKTEQKKKTIGTIKMKLEDGIWKQSEERWHSHIEGDSTSGASSSAFGKPPSEWCRSAREAEFLRKPAAGKLGGKAFTVYEAEYDDFVNTLTLKGPGKEFDKPRITIFLFNREKLPYGESIKCPGDAFSSPHVHLRRPVAGKMKTSIYTGSDKYGMSLSFNEKPADGKLTGYIILRMPDDEKSELNGYFHATVK